MLAVAFQLFAADVSDAGGRSGASQRDSWHRVSIAPALAERLRERDREAYDELIRTTYEPLVSIAHGIVGSFDAAEDVVQDVMVWLWDHDAAWSRGLSPAAYIVGAVRHRALNVVRSHHVEMRYRERIALHAGRDATTVPSDWNAEVQELESALQRALGLLTERQRTALLLRIEQQFTIPEVAGVLEIGVRAAEKLVSRAMRLVRDELGRAIGR
jgi:RNA polymerase sigma factor (sigma-70 family)